MNNKKIVELIKRYKDLINSSEYDELYKWEMVRSFQETWDLEAGDFYSMLEKCLSQTSNLLTGQNYFPKKMILEMAKLQPKEIREMFRTLYDESKDLVERVDYFQERAKEIVKIIRPNTKVQTYQDIRAIALYLNLRYPEKYYFYKYTMFKKFAKLIEYQDFPVGRGNLVFVEFLKFAETVKQILENDSDLLQRHNSQLTEECYKDENHNILTQDFIYSSTSYDSMNINLTPQSNKTLKDYELNTILYGPPGTGKTFNTKNLAIGIIENLSQTQVKERYPDRNSINSKFNEYVKSEQISFVTFHQSFSYEDFVEGIKPTLYSESAITEELEAGNNFQISYQIKSGVFKIFQRKPVNILITIQGKNHFSSKNLCQI